MFFCVCVCLRLHFLSNNSRSLFDIIICFELDELWPTEDLTTPHCVSMFFSSDIQNQF